MKNAPATKTIADFVKAFDGLNDECLEVIKEQTGRQREAMLRLAAHGCETELAVPEILNMTVCIDAIECMLADRQADLDARGRPV